DGCERSRTCIIIFFQFYDDQQRSDFRDIWRVSCNEDNRAIFTNAACKSECETCQNSRLQCREENTCNRLIPGRAQPCRCFFYFLTYFLNNGLNRAHNEWQPDKNQCNDNPRPRESNMDVEW